MYEQGEIVIVPFPFSDLSSIKLRPVLILSKDSDNKISNDIITCGITSNLRDTRYSILIDNSNLKEGQIPTKSRIKIDKLFTLNQSIIKKTLAKINKETLLLIKREFCNLI